MRGPGARVALALWLMACLIAPVAAAPPAPEASVAPVPAARSKHDSEPLRRTQPSAAAPESAATDAARPSGMDMPRVAGALAVVIGLILILRWGGSRIFQTPTHRGSRAIQVVSRTILAPKQQVLLIQVGKRLIVVGDSGAQMSALCQITDPDEVAALLGQVQEEKATTPAAAFGSMFGRARDKSSVEESAPLTEAAASDLEAAEGRREYPHDREPFVGAREEMDPDLATTRQELSGLLDKVRLVSRQLKSS